MKNTTKTDIYALLTIIQVFLHGVNAEFMKQAAQSGAKEEQQQGI